jgi:hypothetical protein
LGPFDLAIVACLFPSPFSRLHLNLLVEFEEIIPLSIEVELKVRRGLSKKIRD